MNVDTFEGNPSIKWFFVTSVPTLVVVICIWYGVKHTLTSQRQNPLRRGVYENLFYDLAEAHPALWTRRGPKEGIIPIGWWSAMKWQLITKWFDPERTIATKDHDPGVEELGMWSRTKRFLVKRWLSDMTIMPPTVAAHVTAEDLESAAINQDLGAVGELLNLATPIGLAGGDPTAASRIRHRLPLGRFRSLSPSRSDLRMSGIMNMEKSGGGEGVSGVMVEEKGEDEVGEDDI
jgi:hypothetical protein